MSYDMVMLFVYKHGKKALVAGYFNLGDLRAADIVFVSKQFSQEIYS